MKLTPTWLFENTDVRFLNNLVLNLWDCGGQDAFMEKYFESQRDQIFRNVEVLIYVFDIESHEREKDLNNFKRCLSAIQENSKDAQVFCLIHKMDLIPKEDMRQRVFEERATELTSLADSLQITCFGTSIWDETLYKAWSSIVYALVPNVEELKAQLSKFCHLCHADEVVLFEHATFLVISSAETTDTTRRHADIHRYEKMSNIIKQFKLSCANSQAGFASMEIRNKNFSAYIDVFTANTYIMIISSDTRIQPAAMSVNVAAARSLFEKFIST
jgi:Ras-related GTP-binding protein A/B